VEGRRRFIETDPRLDDEERAAKLAAHDREHT
jgi:hypothetical protein